MSLIIVTVIIGIIMKTIVMLMNKDNDIAIFQSKERNNESE